MKFYLRNCDFSRLFLRKIVEVGVKFGPPQISRWGVRRFCPAGGSNPPVHVWVALGLTWDDKKVMWPFDLFFGMQVRLPIFGMFVIEKNRAISTKTWDYCLRRITYFGEYCKEYSYQVSLKLVHIKGVKWAKVWFLLFDPCDLLA